MNCRSTACWGGNFLRKRPSSAGAYPHLHRYTPYMPSSRSGSSTYRNNARWLPVLRTAAPMARKPAPATVFSTRASRALLPFYVNVPPSSLPDGTFCGKNSSSAGAYPHLRRHAPYIPSSHGCVCGVCHSRTHAASAWRCTKAAICASFSCGSSAQVM